ncbi:argonaute-like protein [Lentinula aff. lateritia]|uniref:Argonaute-like protein n=1 Tax=Lentinula aff. lateritia TaxID=2804960 RepID=A0ACC1TKD8_9AGAR|nr:argonaute-like protein [Lentinula aff. lateritia]
MPPRPTTEGGTAWGGRGRDGGGGARGGGRPQSIGRGARTTSEGVQSSGLTAHITTVGVRRPGYGTAGRNIKVKTNTCVVQVPQKMIYHYDDIVSEKTLPPRFTMQLVKELQQKEEFLPKGSYDGKKNLFMPHVIDFGGADMRESQPTHSSQPGGRPPPVFKIRIKKVAEINPEVLQRFIDGKQSQDESVQTALTALNVVIRMLPIQNYPFNSRSFFIKTDFKNVGHGFQLRRGYFQSLRPSPGHLLLNIDLSTGMFYKPGPLIGVALEIVSNARNPDPNILSTDRGLPDRIFKDLERFLKNVRVSVQPATASSPPKVHTISSLTREGAQGITFNTRDGTPTTVASYFHNLSGRALRYPDIICAKTAKGAVLPFERCTILDGQLARKQIPPDVTRHMVDFSKKSPAERLASIKDGFGVLGYTESEYVRNFGLDVNEDTFPMVTDARQLPAPKLKYGEGSKPIFAEPRNGAWDMQNIHSFLPIYPLHRRNKKMIKPQRFNKWVMIIFESVNRFGQETAESVARDFVNGCKNFGIVVGDDNPIIQYGAGQATTLVLREAGKKCLAKHKVVPDLLLVILPDGGSDIWHAVKYFGDIEHGVVTQCLMATKCNRASGQYWANVSLKVNLKFGGINAVPDGANSTIISDSINPTIIMGADVMHPAPGSDAPSYSSLVGSVDSRAIKYIAKIKVQKSRQEIIADLRTMAMEIILDYQNYQQEVEKTSGKPKRLLFFRDGVSEGQFKEVMQQEVCADLKISPKITFIIVGKRHHYRFFPLNPQNKTEADPKGNCLAGTVVDKGITHPLEFDFYLLSHGGLLGTSRPAHYSSIVCSFPFYPLYTFEGNNAYQCITDLDADIVCSRARNHYDPNASDGFSESSSIASSDALQSFKPLHVRQSKRMYFMVSL